jgi:hypothetical protein
MKDHKQMQSDHSLIKGHKHIEELIHSWRTINPLSGPLTHEGPQAHWGGSFTHEGQQTHWVDHSLMKGHKHTEWIIHSWRVTGTLRRAIHSWRVTNTLSGPFTHEGQHTQWGWPFTYEGQQTDWGELFTYEGQHRHTWGSFTYERHKDI